MAVEASTFVPPTAGEARHYTRRVAFADRFVGHKMTPSAGNSVLNMYSMAEVIQFALGTRWRENLMDPSWKSGINWMQMDRLVTWLRDVIGDTELADAVEAGTAGMDSYREQVETLRPLFAERIGQYRAVLEEEDAG